MLKAQYREPSRSTVESIWPPESYRHLYTRQKELDGGLLGRLSRARQRFDVLQPFNVYYEEANNNDSREGRVND